MGELDAQITWLNEDDVLVQRRNKSLILSSLCDQSANLALVSDILKTVGEQLDPLAAAILNSEIQEDG